MLLAGSAMLPISAALGVNRLTRGHDPRKQSAKVSRTFRRFHAHGLIAKIAHTRRWRVTLHGRHVMGTSLYLRDQHFPNAYAKIAA
jgi:hypothetical protein